MKISYVQSYTKSSVGGSVEQAVKFLVFHAALGSLVRFSVTPCGFLGGRNGVWVGFSTYFSHFPLPQILFHHFSTLISSNSFHFIPSAPVMVRKAWSAGILAIHISSIKGLHRISSLDPTICRIRFDINFLHKVFSLYNTNFQIWCRRENVSI